MYDYKRLDCKNRKRRGGSVLKHIGEGRIIADDFMHLNFGDIVDVYKYEDGDEIDSTGDMLDSNSDDRQFEYRIFYGKFSWDCFDEEIELL